MDRVLEKLILSLRRSGVRVSPSEHIDALHALELLGYADRQILKGALRSVLAKSQPEEEIFDACFERFFALEIPAPEPVSHDPDDCFDHPAAESPLLRMLLSGEGEGIALAIQTAAATVDVSSLRFFTQKGQVMQRILRELQFESLNRDLMRMSQNQSSAGRALAVQRAGDVLYRSVKRYVDRQFELFAPRAAEPFSEEDYLDLSLSAIDVRDYERVQAIVCRLVKRLNALYCRRRNQARVGVLDFKKTLRVNLANQGILFDARWKKKRPDRPDVIAICDISRSVRHLTRFFLLFLYSLNEVVNRIGTFLFCSNLAEASHIFESYPLEAAIERIEAGKDLEVSMGLTDYGKALADFKGKYFNRVSPKTTVFILGDARNNYDDPRVEILRLLRQRCRRIIWLNPENALLWGTGDSVMPSYLPHCDVARECNTLSQLRAVTSFFGRTA